MAKKSVLGSLKPTKNLKTRISKRLFFFVVVASITNIMKLFTNNVQRKLPIGYTY